jgi:transposase
MRRKRAYRATDVKNVSVEQVLNAGVVGPLSVGLDLGKFDVYVVVRFDNGEFMRPWKVKNPAQVGLLIELLRRLSEHRPLMVAMESTGTYGDPLRGALTNAGLDVRRVSSKGVQDYAELFDGVVSKHDGKDAAIIAELAALGKSSPWPWTPKTENDAALAMWVDHLDAQQSIQMLWIGRLEALLARHWPEITRLIDLTSVTLLSALAHYGGPVALAADEHAASRLAQWGRAGLKSKKTGQLLQAAQETRGVVQNQQDLERMKHYAASALEAYRQTQYARNMLGRLGRDNPVIARQAQAVGMATACVLWVLLGDPRDYPCAEAYRKAMGFNLKEHSSGKQQGRLRISRRGPSLVRRWLYFAAMRMVQHPDVRRWYEAKKSKDNGSGRALIGVARKLALALHAIAVYDEPFAPWRLFPGSSLPGRSLRSSEKVSTCSSSLTE